MSLTVIRRKPWPNENAEGCRIYCGLKEWWANFEEWQISGTGHQFLPHLPAGRHEQWAAAQADPAHHIRTELSEAKTLGEEP